jgi:transposase
MSTGKKRFWSDDEKREICGQTRVEGASVALVARRYAVNANLIHKWLCDPSFAGAADDEADLPAVDGFLLV